jgi:enamine deaminase RidA (YjgF/YER057c/UK114 family)
MRSRAASLPPPAVIQPEGWARPKGYAHGVVAEGRLVFLAGQIGWDARETFVSDDFVDQARQALENVVTLLRAAGGRPEHLVRMTWYVIDKREYLGRLKELGQVYREVVGPTFPAMTVVEVSALIEDRARVEIECTAVIRE